uniref:G-protein coupled receptors family 1 profile domain-containing protein n=1 Tax=Biomphalaria glabrata TaxID=6526 RepID=A0A2C9K7C7_BIOGL
MESVTVMAPPFSPASAMTLVYTTSSFQRQAISAYVRNGSLVNESGVSTEASGHRETKPFQWGMLGLTLIIVCTAVGNLLVCLAVCWEKRLQNMTNYFLMSLAIADFLVSLLVMPLGMVVEIFGYFPMNPEICVLWVASDVLMCSASIWHMCTMSMDRYFTLNYPMRYGRNKTRRMVAGKILFVWIVSMAISTPVCIHGFIDTSIVYNEGMCVPVLQNFLIYGSIFAFYIPLLIMLVTYVLTIRILWKNQKRMRNIDRSDLKPRLAQLTAQCTGFAIPKLLTNLRRASRSPSVSQTPSPTPKCDTRLLRPQRNAAACGGHINATLSDSDLKSSARSTSRVKGSMNYLSPPTPRPCLPKTTPMSATTDTEDSETEPNYFSLLHSFHSCRSLYTPVSMSSAEKSLFRHLQKKQLYLNQQQSLKLQQHRSPKTEDSSPSSPDTSSGNCKPFTVPPGSGKPFTVPQESGKPFTASPESGKPFTPSSAAVCCSSPLVSASQLNTSSPTSPLFEEAQNIHQPLPLAIANPKHSTAIPPITRATDSTTKVSDTRHSEATFYKKTPKKKRYSKRCKKRHGSLTSEQGKPNNLLEVPALSLNRRVRSNRQTNDLPNVLSSAKSDTQVSQAGRGVASEIGLDNNASYSLCHSKMSKDYKSVEWDRRYFQIQEEMDLCLKGEFSRKDKSESSQDLSVNSFENIKVSHEHRPLTQPKSSLPVYLADPLNVLNSCPSQSSHSAPNSPLNRRMSFSFSSDSESSDQEVENTSDKNNADEDNDTSNSSTNDDIITIRLQPPSPKGQANLNCNVENHLEQSKCTNKDLCTVTLSSNTSECYIEMNHSNHGNGQVSANYNSFKTTNQAVSHSFVPCSSTQSLSPASSPLPELVISSEGEMTLEETDDTLDGSPKTNRIKLRRPTQPLHHNKNRFKKKHQTAKSDQFGDKYVKPRKRSSFKNTFRIHRGKGNSKHVLSKKIASNEKKASKVLGIIFLVFVTLWTPFFTVNMLSAICTSCIENITQEMMSLFLWMGYIASLANPIIYTMFNTAFRRTFIRILTCKIQRTCSAKNSDNPYMSYTTMLASERRNTMTVVLRDESR